MEGLSLGASGIRFNDYFFSEPMNLAAWTPPKCPGLFSILVDDPNWAPKAFQPLYFGEFGNNSPASTVLQDCQAVIAAANGKTLFVSVLPMPFTTTHQRLVTRNELISAYNPSCQRANAVDLPPVERRPIGFVPTSGQADNGRSDKSTRML